MTRAFWDESKAVNIPFPSVRCLRCGKPKDATVSRRNVNNRKRGNRTSHDLATYLGGRNVEALKLPWDVEACGARIQSKRLADRPSIDAIRGLIGRIPLGARECRALYFVGAGQRVASGHIFMLMPEWVDEHGWTDPGATVYCRSGYFVIEIPVTAFRELRGDLHGPGAA